jgi:hypothetical protein
MLYMRWSIGALLLYLGALNAFLAWNVETCTGGAADSLDGGLITLPLYVLGWATLPKRQSKVILAVAAIPGLVMAFATVWTAGLFTGISACKLITDLPFEMDGREMWFATLWGIVCVVFWGGLAITVKFAERNRDIPVEQD